MILPGTTNSLYGMHEPMPYDVMPKGWVLFIAQVGHNPEPHPGLQLSNLWADQGYGTIVRIQHEWNPGGTLPIREHLDAYVERVRTLVENSDGCGRWIIGNEPNLSIEWPEKRKLTPEYVGWCYNRCWRAIHDLPRHEQDEVLLPPIGPWNVESDIDWIAYFKRLIEACEFPDGFAIHTYSRGADPSSIRSLTKMDFPYDAYYNGFRTYRDWMDAIPRPYRALPVYLTETNQNGPWLDERNGWIQEMYQEINGWNQRENQTIRCAMLYRWPRYDDYHIDGKTNVIADFQHAQSFDYTWTTDPEPPEPEPPCQPCDALISLQNRVASLESRVLDIERRLIAGGQALLGARKET